MARRIGQQRSHALRSYLLAEAEYMRETYGHIDTAVHAELSKPVDALTAGEQVVIRRYELPTDHPASTAGGPSDELILTADDRLTGRAL